MNCKQVNRHLLTLSPDELIRPDSPALARHINNCPPCHASWQLYKEVANDLTLGAEFDPSGDFWEGWQNPAKSSDSVQPGWLNQFWHRLDWLIAPERSVRWAAAMAIVVFGMLGGVNLQQKMTSDPAGLPNRLVTNSRFIGVMENSRDGLSLMREASNSGSSALMTDSQNEGV